MIGIMAADATAEKKRILAMIVATRRWLASLEVPSIATKIAALSSVSFSRRVPRTKKPSTPPALRTNPDLPKYVAAIRAP
jgi:hypothetical protein